MNPGPRLGGFLRAAREHLETARRVGWPWTRTEAHEATHAIVPLLYVLRDHLTDIAPPGAAMWTDLAELGLWARACVEARGAIEDAGREILRSLVIGAASGSSEPPQAASEIDAGTRSLVLARDLMQTHFIRGGYASDWAAVITSPAVHRPLLLEVGARATQAGWLASTLSSAPGVAGSRRRLLASAGDRLRAASKLIAAAQRQEPAGSPGLLYAIPLNAPPEKSRRAETTIGEVCQYALIAAERVKWAAWQPRPSWSPATCDASLRSTAAAAVVTAHNCGEALRALAARASDHSQSASILSHAASVAADAHAARDRWLTAARAWGEQVVTDTVGRRSSISDEMSDLATWTGRLVYADPEWTPGRGPGAALRAPGAVAKDAGQVALVVAVVHSAAETLHRLARAEADHVRAVAAVGRLHAPIASLPESRRVPPRYRANVPRRYLRPPRERIDTLVHTYAEAGTASARLATTVGEIAQGVGAPTRILAVARQAVAESLPVVSTDSRVAKAAHRPPARGSPPLVTDESQPDLGGAMPTQPSQHHRPADPAHREEPLAARPATGPPKDAGVTTLSPLGRADALDNARQRRPAGDRLPPSTATGFEAGF